MINLWRELEPGPHIPEVIYVIVEIAKGSRNKYEYGKELERKRAKPLGWESALVAKTEINRSIELYREKYGRGMRI